MKENCQLQIGVMQYKNAAMALRNSGIDTTSQHFQMKYMILFLTQPSSAEPRSSNTVREEEEEEEDSFAKSRNRALSTQRIVLIPAG